ncbi:TadE/TadG family type IV pilus assembly protein [Castellaniella sp.]|uniref:TadE/TadG family type IV pilus assembly protein n=1 Tax=Castellaniella sp. TaxID=1955812 RepID=UPI00356876FD
MRTVIQRLKHLRNRQRGATALEFAIVAPLVFVVIFLSLEIAFMLVADATLDQAASRIARHSKVVERDDSFQEQQCHDMVMGILEDTLSVWSDRRGLYAEAKLYKPGEDNSFKNKDDPDYRDKIVCDLGNAGDMVVFRLGFERPGLTGLISLMGLRVLQFERTVIIQNEP